MEGLPRNLEAERALLAACMLDRSRYERIKSRLSSDLWSSARHATIAAAMAGVYRAGLDIDPVTILAEIDRDPRVSDEFRGEDLSGIRTLTEILTATAFSSSAESYLDLVEECATKRNILRAADDLRSMASNGATTLDLAAIFRAYSQKMERVLVKSEGLRSIDIAAAVSGELPAIPWIINGWLGEGDIVLFPGEWATGKSVVALDLAISVASGIHWLGKIPVDRKGLVLYVDEENNARNVSRRISRMVRGRMLQPEDAAGLQIRYLTKNGLRLDTPHGYHALAREIEKLRPLVVILDSLVRLHSSDENDNTAMAKFFAEVVSPLSTRHRCAFVILDHMRKPSKDDEKFDAGHRMRGAGDKAGVGDGIWTLEGERETPRRTLSCRKNRWEDSLPSPITTKWVVSDDETAAWIEASDAKLDAEAAILSLLGGYPDGLKATGIYEICRGAGIPERSARRKLREMVNAGTVESEGTQGGIIRYRLPYGD